MEFLLSFQFAGLALGLAAGALAARRGWDAVPGFLGALAMFVLAILVTDLAQGHGMDAVMGAVALGPVVGIVPVGLGFLAGRWAAAHLRRKR